MKEFIFVSFFNDTDKYYLKINKDADKIRQMYLF